MYNAFIVVAPQRGKFERVIVNVARFDRVTLSSTMDTDTTIKGYRGDDMVMIMNTPTSEQNILQQLDGKRGTYN